jgi:DMSO/TMAO reductase YedYZ molybdopterin-dependent catalytic subunit
VRNACSASPWLTCCAILLLAGCSPGGIGGGARPLAPAEVRDYQGKRLSSIDDFRENSIKGPQQVDRKSYRLRVTGLVERPMTLEYDEVVGRFPHFSKVVTLDCVEGWSVTILWEGSRVRDILAAACVQPGARTVIFRSVDGYSTSFPLSYFDRDILIAYRMNGVELPPERGFPFQLVAEDKWGYKWAKWIDTIELSSDIDYRGYWESRGYSNEGDLGRDFGGP